MPNGTNLRLKFRDGSRMVLISIPIGILGFLVAIGGWFSGLQFIFGGFLLVLLSMYIAISGVQGQITAVYQALRGTQDESSFTEELRHGMGQDR